MAITTKTMTDEIVVFPDTNRYIFIMVVNDPIVIADTIRKNLIRRLYDSVLISDTKRLVLFKMVSDLVTRIADAAVRHRVKPVMFIEVLVAVLDGPGTPPSNAPSIYTTTQQVHADSLVVYETLDVEITRNKYEMHHYLSVVVPDSNKTLNITPQKVLPEQAIKNQAVFLGDDGSEERISYDNDSILYISLEWDNITELESGTLLNFYCDEYKGNGINKSFKWTHPTDGHTYVVRFNSNIARLIKTAQIFGVSQIELKVLGKV